MPQIPPYICVPTIPHVSSCRYYCGLHSQPGQYGYRNGSRSEAVELCMAVAGEQRSIGPHHVSIIVYILSTIYCTYVEITELAYK